MQESDGKVTEMDYNKPIKKATFNMDVALHKELKMVAVREGKPAIKIVEKVFREYLEEI